MTPAEFAAREYRRANIRDALAFAFLVAVWLLAWGIFDPAAAAEGPAESGLADVALALAVITVIGVCAALAFRKRRRDPHDEVYGDAPFDEYLAARKQEPSP